MNKRIYTLQRKSGGSASGIYGFDASSICPNPYPIISPFGPLAAPEPLVSEPDIDVDNTFLASAGNIYIANSKQLLGIDAAGKDLDAFPIAASSANWRSVAVDPSGHIWAGDFQRKLHEFSASGIELNSPIDLSSVVPSGFPKSLDFDANGNLYVGGSVTAVWRLAAPAYDPATAVQVDPQAASGLAIDRSNGEIYVAHQSEIDRYEANGSLIERFPTAGPSSGFLDISIDEASKAVYAFDGGGTGGRVDVFEALTLPDLSATGLSDLTATSATLNGSVDPAGLALTGCKLEYVTETAFLASGFSDLSSGGEAPCSPAFGSIDKDGGPQAVSAAISGLSAGVRYRFRVSASNENGTNSSTPISFALTQPGVETVGSPIRAATTARLDSRIDPHGIPTEYRFEYISDAAYQANLAAPQPPFSGALSTASQDAGFGGAIVLASTPVSGLSPATTYHYRVVADNGAFGGPVTGGERAVTTRSSDAPLGHGQFPGPSGSDRAWEQVSIPDSGGNPVAGAAGIAADGESAAYQVLGGTPVSETGTFFNYLFSRRPPGEHPEGSVEEGGWRTESVFPSRTAAPFSAWRPPTGDEGLATLMGLNLDLESGGGAGVWQIPTNGDAPTKLYEAAPGVYNGLYFFSDDGSRPVLKLKGANIDPGHSSPSGVSQLYDVSSGAPQMILLPGDVVPSCAAGASGIFGFPANWVSRTTHWLSADGSRLYFPNSCSGTHLYMHDFTADETVQVDGPPVSGPNCSGAMIRSTPDAVFFWTQSRLSAADSAVGACDSSPTELTAAGDVYRFDLEEHTFSCLTCVVPGGVAANVFLRNGGEGAAHAIAVAPNGQRLYFTTRSHLLPGAAEAGTSAIYRVNTDTEGLAYVGPLEHGEYVGENPRGNFDGEGTAITPDGRFLAFRSSAPALDQLTASDNASSPQYYLYDDEERSLVCASCPADGSAPRGPTAKGVIPGAEAGPNMTSLAEDGTLAFATPSALAGADQNTAAGGEDASLGTDIYEWRDGRALLVSDGLTSWPNPLAVPKVAAISPSGRDLFFTEAAQLTPDALDGYKRLYDARIGGGIEFPPVPGPCALEVCQGTPKGTPEESAPGSSGFQGGGNEPSGRPCAKGKHRVKGRCVAKKHRKKAKHRKRASHKRGGRP